MKKWVCKICGYVYTGETPPEFCPQCKAPASKFEEQAQGELVWADEHRIGVAEGVDAEILEGLRMNFQGECTEVGMYLAMSRQAAREGYPKLLNITKQLLTKKQNTLQNLQSCWAKLLPPPPRKTWSCVLLLKTALAQAKKKSQPKQNSSVWTLSMTPFMKWQKTKLRHGCTFQVLLNRYFGK